MADLDVAMTVQELKDRADIHDVMVRYCRGVDRCDRALTLSCYHDDATDDHGAFAGSAAGFVDWAIKLHLEQMVWTSHYITNHYCEIDGNEARTETYVEAILRFERDGKLYDISGCGRYLDVLLRREGVWRIKERVVLGDWDRVDEVKEQVTGDLVKKLVRGRRDEQDPSYRYFGKPA